MQSMHIPYGIYTVKAKVSPFTVLIFVIYNVSRYIKYKSRYPLPLL